MTILRSISDDERDQLYAKGLLTLTQLVNADLKQTGLSKERHEALIEETHRVFACCKVNW